MALMEDRKGMSVTQRELLIRSLENDGQEVVYVQFLPGGRVSQGELTIQTVRAYNDGSVYMYTDCFDEDGVNTADVEVKIKGRDIKRHVACGTLLRNLDGMPDYCPRCMVYNAHGTVDDQD